MTHAQSGTTKIKANGALNSSEGTATIDPRYYLALRAYPRNWHRDGRAGELLGLVLDAAEGRGQCRPTLADMGDLVVHGLSARGAGLVRLLSPPLRRRIALLSICSGAVLTPGLLLLGEYPSSWGDNGDPTIVLHSFGPFLTPAVVIYVGWILAFIAALAGRTKTVKTLMVLTIMATVSTPIISICLATQRPPILLLLGLALLNLGVLTAPRTPFSPRERAVSVIACLVITAWIFHPIRHMFADLRQQLDNRYFFYWPGTDQFGLAALGHELPVLITEVLIVAAVAGLKDRSWFAASVVVAIPWSIIAFHAWPEHRIAGYSLVLAIIPVLKVARLLTSASRRGGISAPVTS